jgi:hypothetical protein
MNVPRDELSRAGWRKLRSALWAACGLVALGAACSDDGGDTDGGACVGGDGAVAGDPDTHCGPDDTQAIGACVPSAEAAEEGEEEEEHPILSGREADDDDCKYHVRFENTCVAVNDPVTFTLTLTRKIDGAAGTGTNPAYPEIYLADDVTHISPSNDITAHEGPNGTYEIGPVIFDEPGRWVIRFHYFEDCSDVPEDSPHGHAAFYIDVPAE